MSSCFRTVDIVVSTKNLVWICLILSESFMLQYDIRVPVVNDEWHTHFLRSRLHWRSKQRLQALPWQQSGLCYLISNRRANFLWEKNLKVNCNLFRDANEKVSVANCFELLILSHEWFEYILYLSEQKLSN